jgi:hypothetical protein
MGHSGWRPVISNSCDPFIRCKHYGKILALRAGRKKRGKKRAGFKPFQLVPFWKLYV